VAPYLKLPIKTEALNSVTRGLVGDTSFAVLPDITPRHTFILSIVSQVPPLLKLFFQPAKILDNFLPALTLTAYSSFLFGWHVHEKAILLVLLPFTLLCLRDRRHFAAFVPLAVSGHVSLFPLLFTPEEFLIKTVFTLFWLIAFLVSFDEIAPVYVVQSL
jgi:alpha-1,3-glucosyltransferase